MVSLGAKQKLAKPSAAASKFGATKKINSEFKTKWGLKYSSPDGVGAAQQAKSVQLKRLNQRAYEEIVDLTPSRAKKTLPESCCGASEKAKTKLQVLDVFKENDTG